MSLANAFASRSSARRKGPAATRVALNPQAAGQTMFTSSASARDDQGGPGAHPSSQDDEELFERLIGGDDRGGQGGRSGSKRKGRDSDELMMDGGGSSKKTKGAFGDAEDDGRLGDSGDYGGGLASFHATLGLTEEGDDQAAPTTSQMDQHNSSLSIGDYNIPLDDMGTYGSSIDALELQRFLNSTATSPAPPAPPELEDEPDIVEPEPEQPRLDLQVSAPPAEHSPVVRADYINTLPHSPVVRDDYTNALPHLDAIDPALEALTADSTPQPEQSQDEQRAPSHEQLEMVRQIFGVGPTEELNFLGDDGTSPIPPPVASTSAEVVQPPPINSYELPPPVTEQSSVPVLTPSPAPASASLANKKKASAKATPSASSSTASSVASISKPTSKATAAKTSTPKPSVSKTSASKLPVVLPPTNQVPTPRNPNGSAPGASDFAPPEGGPTAREAASAFAGDEDNPHPCPHSGCDKKFTRKSDFLRHYRIHTGERPFVCSHEGCGKSFIQRSALTVHERVHSGEKPHTCEDCGRQFSDSSSLARHRRIHQGLKPFKCEMCGTKAFSRRATLTRHQNICPGRGESSSKAKGSKQPRKPKGPKIHPSVKVPDGGDLGQPHPLYNLPTGFTGSFTSGSATASPEPSFELELDLEVDDGEPEDDDDPELDEHSNNSHSLASSLSGAALPAIDPAAAANFRHSPAAVYLNLPGPGPDPRSPASAPPSMSPHLTAHRRLSNAPLPPQSPHESATRTEVQPVPRPSGSRRSSPAADGAAKAANAAIDPELDQLEDFDIVPEEQAAAVAALVHGFGPPPKVEGETA
ncbi:hypothetical protein JCM21900_006199 [Sporobolomyces salmonicolor]